MRIVTIVVITLGDALYVILVMAVVMFVVIHRGFFGAVLVYAHLFVVPMLFMTLLRRSFLGKHQRGIVFDGGVEDAGRVAGHHGSRRQAEQPDGHHFSYSSVHLHRRVHLM
jgi:hypothetical protein